MNITVEELKARHSKEEAGIELSEKPATTVLPDTSTPSQSVLEERISAEIQAWMQREGAKQVAKIAARALASSTAESANGLANGAGQATSSPAWAMLEAMVGADCEATAADPDAVAAAAAVHEVEAATCRAASMRETLELRAAAATVSSDGQVRQAPGYSGLPAEPPVAQGGQQKFANTMSAIAQAPVKGVQRLYQKGLGQHHRP